MKLQALLASALLAIPTAGLAMDGDNPGADLTKQVFAEIDSANRGMIDLGEFVTYGRTMFERLDSDGSGRFDLDEFLAVSDGYSTIAEERGRTDAYDTAMKVVFAFWDRNGDGNVTMSEHQKSLSADFRRADLDDDAFLTEDEFVNGFTINVAVRAALQE